MLKMNVRHSIDRQGISTLEVCVMLALLAIVIIAAVAFLGTEVSQTTAGLIILAGYVPQVIKIFSTKTTEGIAISSWALWFLSSLLAFFYAGVTYFKFDEGIPLLFSTGVNLSFISLILFLLVLYRKKNEKVLALSGVQPPSYSSSFSFSPSSAATTGGREAHLDARRQRGCPPVLLR